MLGTTQLTTAQSLGALLKSARDIMCKDKGLNGDHDRLPDGLKLPPISRYVNVNEIIGKFGGAEQLRNAVNQLQSLLRVLCLWNGDQRIEVAQKAS